MEIAGTVDAVLRNKGSGVWSVHPDTMVFDAIKLLAEKNVGALMVIQDGTLVGVFSERDYTRKVALLGKASKQTAVREVITGRIISVSPAATVEECLRLMVEQRVRHLPVLQDKAVVGVVSIGDLVNWVITAQRVTIQQLQGYISGNYTA
jgi:CBS domain-containing protein